MLTLIRSATVVAGAALLALPGLARAAEPPCLTPAEFTALASYTLPEMIEAASQKCGPSLPDTAFLKTGAGALAARYAQGKPAAWPGAKAALFKISAGAGGPAGDILRNLPDANQQQLVDTLVQGVVAEKLPTEHCGTIDHTLRLIAPLPPSTTADIIGLAVGLGARSGQAHLGKFTICGT